MRWSTLASLETNAKPRRQQIRPRRLRKLGASPKRRLLWAERRDRRITRSQSPVIPYNDRNDDREDVQRYHDSNE